MSSLAPLRLPRYRRLLTAYTVNAAGDWLGEIALSVMLFATTHSVLAVSALWILGRFVPALLAPLVVGAVEGTVLGTPAALYLAEAGVFAALAGGVAAGIPIAAILGLALLDGVLAVAARAFTKTAIVATTGPDGLLREANALLGLTFTVSGTAGPVVAGIMVATSGVPAALAVDAVSFAAAAACLRGIEVPPGAAQDGPGLLGSLRAAARHVGGSPVLRRLFSAEAAGSVLLACVVPVELVYVTQTLGGTAKDFGTTLAAWGLGAVGGSAAMNVLLRRAGSAALLVSGVLVMIVGYLGMGAATHVPQVIAFSVVGGLGNGLEGLAFATLVQERTPLGLQTQINGLVESLHTAAPGAGYVLGGAIAALASPRATFWVAGIGALLVLLAAMAAAGRSAGQRPRSLTTPLANAGATS
jgi:hypothetical protein